MLWFILLHEAGHFTLFSSTWTNRLVGHIAGFFSGFPYVSWRLIHQRHHKWTGWQDLDATTASLVPRELKRFEKKTIDFCWKYWIPLFGIIYRLNNYWNLPRLNRYILKPKDRTNVLVNVVVLLVIYGILIYTVGFERFLNATWLGVCLHLVVQEAVLLSQHTHIPSNVSHGEKVRPFKAQDQEIFTRSLRFPQWFSKLFLVHFDAHELHHMYVHVPGYDLKKIEYSPNNEVDWWEWIKESRRLQGTVFFFQNRGETGFSL
jgi:fatty acid desaturase